MTESPLHREIVAMADLMSRPDAPGVNTLVGIPPSRIASVAREMFLNVFVAQALDEMGDALEHNKQYIAAKAAELALRVVDMGEAGIAEVRARIGVRP